MTYIFTCRECGSSIETSNRLLAPADKHGTMQRDYRSENAAPATSQLRKEREAGGRRAIRDLFLPQAKDFESPSDPDGEKGLRQWADETKPKDGNKKPLWPDMKKKVHAVGGK